MKNTKSKREIKFVLSGEEIKLLMQVNDRFSKEFSNKNLCATKYEFTYSYAALYQLGFDVTGAAYFTAPEKLRPQLNRLAEKITRLLKLSDSLSQAASKTKKIRFCSVIFILFTVTLATATTAMTEPTQVVVQSPTVQSYDQLVSAIRKQKESIQTIDRTKRSG